MDRERVQQIVRWDMALLEQSPWYQEILQEGVVRGLEQGLLEGRRADVLNVLGVRFALPEATHAQLREQLARLDSAEVLEALLIAAVQAESLEAWMTELAQKGT